MSLGCELWQRVLRIFNPSGIRATWDNHEVFSKVAHHNKEPIESLAHRIVETADLLSTGSGGLIPANSFSNKLKLAQCVCLGPYHKAFEAILEDITVTQKDEWDITVPSLTYEDLTTRLGNHLRRSVYMTSTGLKNGSQMPSATARAATLTFDKWGMVNRSQKDALIWLNRYFNTTGNVRGCPICAGHKSHPFTSCPALIARGFTVSYEATNDTNPDLGYRKPGHPTIAARKANVPAPAPTIYSP